MELFENNEKCLDLGFGISPEISISFHR